MPLSTIALASPDSFTWEACPQYPDTEEQEEAPCPRAGHTAAVVGTRMYVWSGRDGYKKVWNNQVCTGPAHHSLSRTTCVLR